MNRAQQAAAALESSLRELLGVLGEEGATAETVELLRVRCSDLTTSLVDATTACSAPELEAAAPALRSAQRLNAIARGAVERQRDTLGALIAGAHRIRRTLGADAPVPDGTSCDMQA